MNQCIVCGKETKNKKYCSIECKAKAMSKPKGKCLYCGKELDRCEVKYCSSECYQLDKKRKYEKSLVYNSCIICGAPTLNEKYCSMKCMGQDSSRHEFAIKNLKNEHIWTPAEIQYLEENYGIISPNEMEEYLGIKKANIVAYASKHNILIYILIQNGIKYKLLIKNYTSCKINLTSYKINDIIVLCF